MLAECEVSLEMFRGAPERLGKFAEPADRAAKANPVKSTQHTLGFRLVALEKRTHGVTPVCDRVCLQHPHDNAGVTLFSSPKWFAGRSPRWVLRGSNPPRRRGSNALEWRTIAISGRGVDLPFSHCLFPLRCADQTSVAIGRRRQTRHAAYPQAQFCHTPAGKRVRHSHAAGTVGSRRRRHHDDLDPRLESVRDQRPQPARCAGVWTRSPRTGGR